MKLTADTKWLVGVALGLLGLLIPIILSTTGSPAKSLAYNYATFGILDSLPESLLHDIKILYNGEELADLHFSFVSLKNSGAVPITRSDFDSAIQLDVLGAVKVLNAGVGSTIPQSLEAKVVHQENLIKIAPMLWNPGDTLTVHILSSGRPKQFEIRARIVGIRELIREEPNGGRPAILTLGLFGWIGAFYYGLFGMDAYFVIREKRRLQFSTLLEIGAAACLAILSVFALREGPAMLLKDLWQWIAILPAGAATVAGGLVARHLRYYGPEFRQGGEEGEGER